MEFAIQTNKVTITSQEFAKMVNKSLSNKVGLGLYNFPGFDLSNYFVEGSVRTLPEWKRLASEAANDLIDEEGFNDFI
jgi:hypothetical protein